MTVDGSLGCRNSRFGNAMLYLPILHWGALRFADELLPRDADRKHTRQISHEPFRPCIAMHCQADLSMPSWGRDTTALITGGARGIGRAIAERYLE